MDKSPYAMKSIKLEDNRKLLHLLLRLPPESNRARIMQSLAPVRVNSLSVILFGRLNYLLLFVALSVRRALHAGCWRIRTLECWRWL